MKPLLLEMQAFGPFRGYEAVDFAALSQPGLFLIAGKTGSGKSTVLDGITFALFGVSSGDGRNDFQAMRCRQSEKDTPTFVRFTAEFGDRVYRFERTLTPKRKNIAESQNVLARREDGTFEPLFENCKKQNVNAKAKELIGLDADQFRRVVILPQGQFERLLVADSGEKEVILTKIFGVDKWQKIADSFYAIAEGEYKAAASQRDAIRARLSSEGCADLPALAQRLGDLQENLHSWEQYQENCDFPARQKDLQTRRELLGRFAELHRLERRNEMFAARKAELSADVLRMNRAQKAEPIRLLLAVFDNARQASAAKESVAKTRELQLQSAKQHAQETEAVLAIHAAREPEIQKLREQAALLEAREGAYRQMNDLSFDVRQKQAAKKQADSVYSYAAATHQNNLHHLDSVFAQYTGIRQEHQNALNVYMRGISGELAATLQPGLPCPVCGSTHHPAPAPRLPNGVTREVLKALEQREQEMQQRWEKARASCESSQAALNQAQSAALEAESAMQAAVSRLEAARANLIPGIDNLQALRRTIDSLRGQAESFRIELQQLSAAQNAAAASCERASTALSASLDELANAQQIAREALAALQDAVTAAGFADEAEARAALMAPDELNRLADGIRQWQAQAEECRRQTWELAAALQDSAEPDPAQIEADAAALSKAEKECIHNIAVLSDACRRLDALWQELSAAQADLDARWAQVESDHIFAESLRGKTGISLQRYVLGVMFGSVIAAANAMLRHVQNGRYTLYRSDEKGDGNKRGLELYVHDTQSPEDAVGRSVRTLSGGEKFLVSLALSIGLSTVAQHGGMELEAMFIDEGFGTLDETSIGEAMEVLQTVQGASGMVGIISHVQLLRDNIPSKLLVSQSGTGSHITQSIG